MAGTRVLRISPELLLQFFTPGVHRMHYEVTSEAIPKDARITGCAMRDDLLFAITSEEFFGDSTPAYFFAPTMRNID